MQTSQNLQENPLNPPSAENTASGTAAPASASNQGAGRIAQPALYSGAPLRRPWAIIAVAFGIALLTDLATYNHQGGTQWALFVNLALLGGLLSALIEKKRVPWASYLLMVLTSLSSLLTLFRAETFTTLALGLFSATGLALLAASLLSGEWHRFRLRELVVQSVLLLPSIFIGLPRALRDRPRRAEGGERRALPAVLRGVLIALPLLLIFGALFASADTIFADQLQGLAAFFGAFNLGDGVAQAFLILMITWFLTGMYWHALTQAGGQPALEPDQPLMSPLLGFTESVVVLALLNALFLAFVIIQFRYFFAGAAAISVEGFTYAEYARRGFFELLAVALLAGGVFWLLSGTTRREKAGQKVWFSTLGIILLMQVGVVLLSAFQRLSLYENAYGFTAERLSAHIFMIFLAVVLVLLAVLELTGQMKRLALVLVLALFAFGVTLAAVNVDAQVAQRNLSLAAQPGGRFDPGYLIYGVGEDATEALYAGFDAGVLSPSRQEQLGLVLACRAQNFSAWQAGASFWSWTATRARAAQAIASHRSELLPYQRQLAMNGNQINLEGAVYYCMGGVD